MTTISIPSFPTVQWTGFEKLKKAMQARRQERINRQAVRGLNDHMMRDIGLTPEPKDPAVLLMDAWVR